MIAKDDDDDTYFWCSIAWTSTRCFQGLGLFIHITQSKIDDFEGTIEIEEQILWFEVTMANS